MDETKALDLNPYGMPWFIDSIFNPVIWISFLDVLKVQLHPRTRSTRRGAAIIVRMQLTFKNQVAP